MSLSDVLKKTGFGQAAPAESGFSGDTIAVPKLNNSTKRDMSDATKSNPVFVKTDVFKEGDGLAACLGTKDVTVELDKFTCAREIHARFMCLDKSAKQDGKPLFGTIREVPFSEVHVSETLEVSPELTSLYEAGRASIEWNVIASRYEDVPKDVQNHVRELYREGANSVKIDFEIYGELRKLRQVSETSYIVSGQEAIDFEDLQRWMIENHPSDALFYGASNNKGSFSFTPTPCAYTYEAIVDTAAREAEVKRMADRLGCSVGEFDHTASESQPVAADVSYEDDTSLLKKPAQMSWGMQTEQTAPHRGEDAVMVPAVSDDEPDASHEIV